MTKATMVCPFSKGKCIECGIFRGRHMGLCLKTKDEPSGDKLTKTKCFSARDLNAKWEVPAEFALGDGCVKNVEDCDPDSADKRAGDKSHKASAPKGREKQ